MALDVENAVEAWRSGVDVDLDAIGHAVDDDVRSREVGAERRRFCHTSDLFVFEREAGHALAQRRVVGRATLRVGIADDVGARIDARSVAGFVVGTVGVGDALGRQLATHANARRARHQAFGLVAYALSGGLVADQTPQRIADARAVGQANHTLFERAQLVGYLGHGRNDALDSRVADGAGWTDAEQRAVRLGRSHLALGRRRARSQLSARIDALGVDASLQRRTFRVGTASLDDVGATTGRVGCALETGRTLAHGRMVGRSALLRRVAHVG